MSLSRRCVPAVFLMCAAILAGGCSSEPPGQGAPSTEDENLMRLVQLYNSYQKKNNGKIPGSPDDLKRWAKAQKPDELKKMGIEGDVDALFVSPRDNQPYQLAKPTNPMAAKMGGQSVIFYEKEGVSGTHRVVGGMGTRPRELTREELKTHVPGFAG